MNWSRQRRIAIMRRRNGHRRHWSLRWRYGQESLRSKRSVFNWATGVKELGRLRLDLHAKVLIRPDAAEQTPTLRLESSGVAGASRPREASHASAFGARHRSARPGQGPARRPADRDRRDPRGDAPGPARPASAGARQRRRPHRRAMGRRAPGGRGDHPPLVCLATPVGAGRRTPSNGSAAGYALEMPPEWIDVGRFESLARDGLELQRRRRHRRAAADLRAALELWRGEPFAGRVCGRGPQDGGGPSRGAAHERARSAGRIRSRARKGRGASRRARGAHRAAPVPGTALAPLDGRALSRRAAGGRARGVPPGTGGARRGARD